MNEKPNPNKERAKLELVTSTSMERCADTEGVTQAQRFELRCLRRQQPPSAALSTGCGGSYLEFLGKTIVAALRHFHDGAQVDLLFRRKYYLPENDAEALFQDLDRHPRVTEHCASKDGKSLWLEAVVKEEEGPKRMKFVVPSCNKSKFYRPTKESIETRKEELMRTEAVLMAAAPPTVKKSNKRVRFSAPFDEKLADVAKEMEQVLAARKCKSCAAQPPEEEKKKPPVSHSCRTILFDDTDEQRPSAPWFRKKDSEIYNSANNGTTRRFMCKS